MLIQGQKSSSWELTAAYADQAAYAKILTVNLFCHEFRDAPCMWNSGEGLNSIATATGESLDPSPPRQRCRLLLRSRWGTAIQRQEIVALGYEMGMLSLGLQWVVFWFQQYFENQNVMRNSKRLQKPKDKSERVPYVFTILKQLQLKLGHCQPSSKGYTFAFQATKD